MATIGFRTLRAVIAAAIGGLMVACGGGGESSQPTQVQPTVSTVAPFTGTAVDRGTDLAGQPRAKALSAPATQARPTFTTATQVAAGAQRIDALASAAEAPADRVMTAEQTLDAAEGAYPALFPPHQDSQVGVADGMTFRYRCYVSTGYCLGISTLGPNAGHVYSLYRGVLTDHGTTAFWSCVFEPVRCGPRIMSARILFDDGRQPIDARGAVNVPAKGTKLELVMSDLINCAGLNGTRVVGEFLATVDCRGQTLTFTPGLPGETRWPFGSTNTLTLAGVRSVDGYPSPSEIVSFTTRVAGFGQGAKVYTGNWAGKNPNVEAGNAMSIYDVTTQTIVRQIDYGLVPGYGILNGQVVVDPVAGVVYQAPWSGFRIYRVDLETGEVLTPITIDPSSTSNQRSRGLVVVGNEVCQVLGVPDFTGQTDYYLDNSVACFNAHTLANTFMGSRGHVADASMIATGMYYSRGRNKIYITNALRSAYFLEQTPWGVRDGWRAGTRGTVTEIDATTRSVTRTFEVGSAPTSPFVDEQAGKLYVFNMGGKSVSVVNLVTGSVTTTPLGMSGFERPATALPDWDEGRIYVSDDAGTVRVLNSGTLQEVGRINLGDGDIAAHMAIVRGKLWVASSLQNIGAYNDKVIIINRDTLAVERKIANRSSLSGAPNQPYAITAWDPGP